MANLHHQHPNEGWSQDGNWWVDCNVYLNSQDTNGNYSNVTIEIVTYSTSSGISQSGSFNGQIWVNGGLVANATSSRTISNGGQQIAVWSGNIGHDANGNASPYVEYYSNMPATSMSRRGGNWGLTRIPLAPPITDWIADTIKPTSVRLGIEIGGFGHGTSCAMYTQYRLQGDVSWIGQTPQNDVGGYNYFPVTGLKPGKTYEYRAVAYNNNGDQTVSGVRTFKTQPISGMIPVMLGLLGG